MYTKNTLSLLAKAGVMSSLMFAMNALANPAQSIGQSKSTSVDLHQLYNRGVTWTEYFVNGLGAAGVVIGMWLFIHCLLKIHAINSGKAQGSIPLQFVGIFISFIIMSIVAWSFWGAIMVRQGLGG